MLNAFKKTLDEGNFTFVIGMKLFSILLSDATCFMMTLTFTLMVTVMVGFTLHEYILCHVLSLPEDFMVLNQSPAYFFLS
jgi:hypothetical protein